MTRAFKSMIRTALRGMVGALFAVAYAQSQEHSAQQVLTLRVIELSTIDISHKTLSLVIDKARVEAGGPAPVVNTDGKLVWMTNGDNKKITVSTDNTSKRFTLRLAVLDGTRSGQVKNPDVVLAGEANYDLIVGLNRTAGECRIQYTASAELADGTGIEAHTITYTITGS